MAKPSGNKRQPRTYQEVIQRIQDEGYTIKQEGGHRAVRRANGSLLFMFGATPSDTRGARQTWSSFVRAVRQNG